MVEPVAILVMSRLFHTLALQSSRFLPVPSLRILRRCGQVGDVASLQRFDELMKDAAACPPRAARGPIDLRSIARIANHLRQWAPAIVPAHTRDDDGASSSDDSLAAPASQRRMHLRWCLLQLDNLRVSLDEKDWRERRPGGRGWQFDTYSLLQCMRLVLHLRNRSKLPLVLEKALALAMPMLTDEIRASLTLDGRAPSAATLGRTQPCLDACLLLLHKKMLESKKWLLYVWADSSPQLSYNFFISTMVAISEDSIVEVSALAAALARTVYTPDLSEEEAELILVARSEMIKKLSGLLLKINNMPQCLALGGATLEHKIRCLLHIFWMMCGPCPRLPRVMTMAHNVMSFTTDMGVESGLADAVSPSLKASQKMLNRLIF